jgi:hypothetical protein
MNREEQTPGPQPQLELDMVRISKGTRLGAVLLLLAVLLMGVASVVSSYLEWNHYIDSQRAQGAAIDARLCSTLDKLAALKAPAGPAGTNPSRAYEQQLAMTLAELKNDIGCGA